MTDLQSVHVNASWPDSFKSAWPRIKIRGHIFSGGSDRLTSLLMLAGASFNNTIVL